MASQAAAKNKIRKIVKIILKKKNVVENEKKKKVPVGPHRLTRPLDRKQHFF